MRVLIATPYYLPRVGGLELYAAKIASSLVQNGHEVHVVTSGSPAGVDYIDGVTVHRLPIWLILSNTPINPLWPLVIHRLVKRIKPDVINVHAPVPTIALATTLAAGSTPVVVTYHAGSMKKGRALVDYLIAIYESIALPWMLNRATSVICASEFVQRSFLSRWTAKSTTITPGVDTERFTPAVGAFKNRIAFVGDFRDPRKGLPVLLDAVRQLPKVSLTVIGEGEAKPEPGVDYLGVKRGDELVKALNSSTVLVLPSTTEAESFGMVLLEAMACGLPVVGSRIGGIPTVISDGEDGVLVEPASPLALANAIARLLAFPEQMASMGENGRRKVKEHFTWEKSGALTEMILREAIR